jgi:hypothetical protein
MLLWNLRWNENSVSESFEINSLNREF